MTQNFHISLESPQCGWMALAVRGGGAEVRYGAARAPYDSLGDLLRGLKALLEGQTVLTVKWNAEPEEYDWHFTVDGEQIMLAVNYFPDHRRAADESREVFVHALPLKDLCRAVADETRELQARAERDVFASNWQRPFPAPELEELSAALARA